MKFLLSLAGLLALTVQALAYPPGSSGSFFPFPINPAQSPQQFTQMMWSVTAPSYVQKAGIRFSQTHATNCWNRGDSNIFYLSTGSGIVRNIELSSSDANINTKSNLQILVYCDQGTVTDPQLVSSNYLCARLPLDNLLCDRWPVLNSQIHNIGTRYYSAMWQENNAFTLNLNYPIPFTNGCLILLQTRTGTIITNNTWTYTAYDLGTLPDELSGMRLRTFNVVGPGRPGGTGRIIGYWPAGGSLLSMFISATDTNSETSAFNVLWSGAFDRQSTEAFSSAGGEDTFNSGFDWSVGGMSTNFDWGSIHHYSNGSTASTNEAYRHFDPLYGHQWNTNIGIRGPTGTRDNSILVVYLGQTEPALPTTDPDASNFLQNAGIGYSDTLTGAWMTTSNALVRYVSRLKRDNAWTPWLELWPFVGNTSSSANAQGLKATYPITWHGTVTFNASGITGDGSTGWGDSGIVLSNVTTLNQGAGFFIWNGSSQPCPANGILMGVAEAGGNNCYLQETCASGDFRVSASYWFSNLGNAGGVGAYTEARGPYFIFGAANSPWTLPGFPPASQTGYFFAGNFGLGQAPSGNDVGSIIPGYGVTVGILARNGPLVQGYPDKFSAANLMSAAVCTNITEAQFYAFWDASCRFQTELNRNPLKIGQP